MPHLFRLWNFLRDPAHQQLHDPGLLRSEHLAPEVFERLQRGDHVGFGEGAIKRGTLLSRVLWANDRE